MGKGGGILHALGTVGRILPSQATGMLDTSGVGAGLRASEKVPDNADGPELFIFKIFCPFVEF